MSRIISTEEQVIRKAQKDFAKYHFSIHPQRKGKPLRYVVFPDGTDAALTVDELLSLISNIREAIANDTLHLITSPRSNRYNLTKLTFGKLNVGLCPDEMQDRINAYLQSGWVHGSTIGRYLSDDPGTVMTYFRYEPGKRPRVLSESEVSMSQNIFTS